MHVFNCESPRLNFAPSLLDRLDTAWAHKSTRDAKVGNCK